MSPSPHKRSAPGLQLEGLAELAAADLGRSTSASAFQKPRAARNGGGWRIYYAGWLGIMFGPLPIGHLALGLLGLYFKLKA
jgi:hypothetical protein